jgi:Holliday junction resolvase RusA-like endonuclease
MMTPLLFTIPGEPKGKQRPRVTRTGHAYTPKETAVYENLVKMEYLNQCGGERKLNGPIKMFIRAFFSIAASVSQKKRNQMLNGYIRPTKKPDLDNIVKIVADSLNKIAYDDDSQIIDITVGKYFSDKPRVEVIITEIEGMEDLKCNQN